MKGYILDSLKANREQANKQWNWHNNDDPFPWYVKPRIRIDSNFVDTNPNDTVCRIDILDWDGNFVKKVGILGRHFSDDAQFNYNGRYKDEFNFIPQQDEDLIILAGAICPGPVREGLNWWSSTPVKTDFRVYWYGTCEMWIDYVRVENQPSVELTQVKKMVLVK